MDKRFFWTNDINTFEYSFSHRDCNDESLAERNNLDVIGENKKREKTNLSNHSKKGTIPKRTQPLPFVNSSRCFQRELSRFRLIDRARPSNHPLTTYENISKLFRPCIIVSQREEKDKSFSPITSFLVTMIVILLKIKLS